MYERILITGGAGFVGSSLALHLRNVFPDAVIVAFDNLRRRGAELNLTRLSCAGIRFIHGDVRCPEDLEAAGRPDLIIEASAEPSAQAGYGGSPEYLIETNLNGCFRCLEYARRSESDFLFISTSRVYPVRHLNALACREDATRYTLLDEQTLPGASGQGIAETFPLDGPRSLYGMTKLAAELMIAEYGDAYGLRYAIDRCGLIAGPWQMGKTDQGVAALWVAAHYFRQPLQYIGFGGAGKQVRDVLHVADLCDLVELQLRSFDRFEGKLFNAGGGLECSLSLSEMTTLAEAITGNRIEIAPCAQKRPADVRVYVTDHRALTDFCGWRPLRGARATLSDIAEWIRANENLLRPILSA